MHRFVSCLVFGFDTGLLLVMHRNPGHAYSNKDRSFAFRFVSLSTAWLLPNHRAHQSEFYVAAVCHLSSPHATILAL